MCTELFILKGSLSDYVLRQSKVQETQESTISNVKEEVSKEMAVNSKINKPNVPSVPVTIPTKKPPSQTLMMRIQRDLDSPSAACRVRAMKALKDPVNSPYAFYDADESNVSEKKSPTVAPSLKELFRNIAVYVEVRTKEDNRSEGVKKVIAEMGAHIHNHLHKNTTHVVFKDGLLSTYKKAKGWGIPIVSILWIDACKSQKRLCNPKDFPITNLDRYENPELYEKFKRQKAMQPDSEVNKRIRVKAIAGHSTKVQTPKSTRRRTINKAKITKKSTPSPAKNNSAKKIVVKIQKPVAERAKDAIFSKSPRSSFFKATHTMAMKNPTKESQILITPDKDKSSRVSRRLRRKRSGRRRPTKKDLAKILEKLSLQIAKELRKVQEPGAKSQDIITEEFATIVETIVVTESTETDDEAKKEDLIMEISNRMRNQVPEEQLKQMPTELLNDLAKKLFHGMPKESCQELPKNICQESSIKLLNETPKKLLQESPKRLSHELHNKTPKKLIHESPIKLPHELRKSLRTKTPRKINTVMSEKLLKTMPKNAKLQKESPKKPKKVPKKKLMETPLKKHSITVQNKISSKSNIVKLNLFETKSKATTDSDCNVQILRSPIRAIQKKRTKEKRGKNRDLSVIEIKPNKKNHSNRTRKTTYAVLNNTKCEDKRASKHDVSTLDNQSIHLMSNAIKIVYHTTSHAFSNVKANDKSQTAIGAKRLTNYNNQTLDMSNKINEQQAIHNNSEVVSVESFKTRHTINQHEPMSECSVLPTRAATPKENAEQSIETAEEITLPGGQCTLNIEKNETSVEMVNIVHDLLDSALNKHHSDLIEIRSEIDNEEALSNESNSANCYQSNTDNYPDVNDNVDTNTVDTRSRNDDDGKDADADADNEDSDTDSKTDEHIEMIDYNVYNNCALNIVENADAQSVDELSTGLNVHICIQSRVCLDNQASLAEQLAAVKSKEQVEMQQLASIDNEYAENNYDDTDCEKGITTPLSNEAFHDCEADAEYDAIQEFMQNIPSTTNTSMRAAEQCVGDSVKGNECSQQATSQAHKIKPSLCDLMKQRFQTVADSSCMKISVHSIQFRDDYGDYDDFVVTTHKNKQSDTFAINQQHEQQCQQIQQQLTTVAATTGTTKRKLFSHDFSQLWPTPAPQPTTNSTHQHKELGSKQMQATPDNRSKVNTPAAGVVARTTKTISQCEFQNIYQSVKSTQPLVQSSRYQNSENKMSNSTIKKKYAKVDKANSATTKPIKSMLQHANDSKEQFKSKSVNSKSTANTQCVKRKALPVLVYTNMRKSEIVVIETAIRKLGGIIEDSSVTENTTHVVSLEPRRTMNLLRALARGLWILNYKWITHSVASGCWQNEELFILNNFSKAIEICRAERQAFGASYRCELFTNSGLFFISPKCSSVTKDNLCELVKLCGGKITDRRRRAKYIIGEVNKLYEDKIFLTPSWILDSITNMQLQRLSAYTLVDSSNAAPSPTQKNLLDAQIDMARRYQSQLRSLQ